VTVKFTDNKSLALSVDAEVSDDGFTFDIHAMDAATRDDFGPESDVDVLVEFQAGHVPGLNFVSIEREFSELVRGRRVDMVTSKFLNPRIRDQVLGSAELLYVAA